MNDTDQAREHLGRLRDELRSMGYRAELVDRHPLRHVALAVEQPAAPGRPITVICDVDVARPCYRWPHDYSLGPVTEVEHVADVLRGFLGPPADVGPR